MSIDTIIKCNDLNTSLNFYTKVLDFEVMHAANPDLFMSVFLKRENSSFYISQRKGESLFKNAVYIKVESIDEIYAKFMCNGLNANNTTSSARQSNTHSGGISEFSVEDPDGNKIIFGEGLK